MLTVFLSTERGMTGRDQNTVGWLGGHLRNTYRQYERVQRRTPSGRIYDSVSIIKRDGSAFTSTALLTPEGDRTLRRLYRCDREPRTTTTHEETP
jgi:hypothetical protein